MENLVIEFWYWWVIALLLLGIELLAPGFFFLWMAVSGFFTGCWVLAVPTVSFNIQLLVFSVLSIVSIIIWKFYVKKYPLETDQPLLNKRGAQYIGRIFTLIEPIENGHGKIKVDDSIWKVYGKDCPLNTKVKVVAIRGTVFDVEKIN